MVRVLHRSRDNSIEIIVTRKTINNANNGHRKERKSAILNTNKARGLYISKATPEVVRMIQTMILNSIQPPIEILRINED